MTINTGIPKMPGRVKGGGGRRLENFVCLKMFVSPR